MKKNELVMELSERTDLPKIDTERVLNEFISVVKERLKEGDKVYLAGFGTIYTKEEVHRQRKGGTSKRSYVVPALDADIAGVDNVKYKEVFGMVNALN